MTRSTRKPLVLAFDAALYPLASVRAAATAWAEVARVSVRKVGARVRVTLAPHPGAPDDATLAGEFANYALGLVCEARRRG
jgi:hypothetical protein